MPRATGSFEVTSATEDPYDELEGGGRLTHASGQQSFRGDIDGLGSVHWLMLYRPDRTAHFVGLQRVSGSVGDRRGAFVAAAEGDHDGAASAIHWTIVAGSGTGGLSGIKGTGELAAPGGRIGSYELDYTFES